jgi:CsbD-like.
MNKDQVKGHIKEAKGTVKQAAGKVTGKVSLEQKGKLQKAAGKAQAGYGDIKKDIRQDK